MKMRDSESIDTYGGKLSELASQSAALGHTIEEPKLVKKFLNSLPRSKFIQIIASLEQVLNLNNTGYEDIIGRLKVYEERILKEEGNSETQGNLLFSSMNSRGYQGSFENSRGRGRGRGRGRSNRGRGRGRFNTQDQPKKKKDRSNVVCFRCDKAGHFASVCPE